MDDISEFGGLATGERRPTHELIAGYSYLAPGDIAYAKVTPCFENGKGIPTGEVYEDTFATTEVTVLRAHETADPGYLGWLLQSAVFREPAIASMTGAGGLRRVPESVARDLSLPAPGLREQRQIADYLDHETAEIDAFIADLEHTKSISNEQWRTRRDFLLSGGDRARADPRTWFGRIDPSWQVGALKHLFSVTLGKMLDEKKQNSGAAYPYVRAANIGDGTLDLEDVNSMTFDAREREKYSLRKRDILVVEGGSVGMNFVLADDIPGIYFQKTVNRLRPRGDVSSMFYAEVINAYREAGVFEVIGNRSTIMHLTAEKLEALRVPVPNADEQHRVADRLGGARAARGAAEADIDAAIALAKERRAALITAAVTGQIDVTTKQTPAVDSIQTAIEESR